MIDGPVMWLLTPPRGWDSAQLVALNKMALLPSVIVFLRPGCHQILLETNEASCFVGWLRPWFWPALAVCWIIWYQTHSSGGQWFYFGWDAMMDEIGFLACILSITLTLYDDIEAWYLLIADSFHLFPVCIQRSDGLTKGIDSTSAQQGGTSHKSLGRWILMQWNRYWTSRRRISTYGGPLWTQGFKRECLFVCTLPMCSGTSECVMLCMGGKGEFARKV